MEISGSFPKACCELPPVQAQHDAEGDYIQVADLKTYVIGDEDSKQAVLLIPDIFGITPQALQGADLLGSQGFRVYLPDIFKGQPLTVADWQNPEKKAKWFSSFPGQFESQAAPIGAVISEIAKKHGKVGAAGFCWGWKALVVNTQMGDLSAVAGCHPSFIAADDSEKITCPVALIPSEMENMTIIKEIYEGLNPKVKEKSFIKQYDKAPHGFMAARAQLDKPEDAKNFKDGYSTLSAFFKEVLV